jgi:acyl-CoA dehydrogenase
MGMTQEHPLHQLSRRMWSWRSEYGDAWSARLGQALLAQGPDVLYRTIAEGSGAGIIP